MSETSSLDDPPRSAAISEPARDQIYPERPESRRYPATTAHTNGPENPGGFADRGGTATPFEPKEKEVDHVFPTRNPQQQDPDSGTMTTLDLVDAPPWNTPVDGDSADGSRYGTLMRQVVNQSVYRRNAFRLTGLPVNATAPQIRRRGTELCALARVGAPPPAQPGVLPTAESLTESDVQETLQALRNPDRRLVEDLFWFWPDTTGENKTNPSPPVLDAENAREHWEQLLRTHPAESPAAAVALHNLAVLTHAQALDSECDGHVDAPLWANALRWWLAVLTTDACWTHLTDRVRDLGDTRLSPQSVADLRQALPEALLSINTALLVQADTESAADRTRRSQQQRIIIDSKFPSAAVNRARMTAAEPVLALLRAACAPIRKAPPLNGAITAAAFLDRIAHPVAVLDDLLTTGHPLLEGIRDEVAMTAQDAVIEYSNRTWEPNSDPTQGPCLDLLGRIEGIAATDSVKKHIRDNRDSIRGHPGCWFCHDDERVDFHDRYTATITRPPGTKDETQPNTGRMHISRCKRCHIKHVHAQRTATVLHWLAAILGGILLTFRINIGTYPNWFVTSIIPITLWLMALLYERRTNQKILLRAAAYPPVAECIEQGWKLDGLRRRRR